jgi:hypothetical protein
MLSLGNNRRSTRRWVKQHCMRAGSGLRPPRLQKLMTLPAATTRIFQAVRHSAPCHPAVLIVTERYAVQRPITAASPAHAHAAPLTHIILPLLAACLLVFFFLLLGRRAAAGLPPVPLPLLLGQRVALLGKRPAEEPGWARAGGLSSHRGRRGRGGGEGRPSAGRAGARGTALSTAPVIPTPTRPLPAVPFLANPSSLHPPRPSCVHPSFMSGPPLPPRPLGTPRAGNPLWCTCRRHEIPPSPETQSSRAPTPAGGTAGAGDISRMCVQVYM